jgi:hypothetical protein
MKSTLKITGFILLILLSGSMSLTAQYGRGRGGIYGPIGPVTPVLSEKQKTDIAALGTKYRVEIDTLRAQLRRSTDIKKRGDLASKIQILSDTYISDAKNVLTAEQKKSIETAKANLVKNRNTRDSIFKSYSKNDSLGRGRMQRIPSRMGPMDNNFIGRGLMPAMPFGREFGRNNFYNRGYSNGNRYGNMYRRR